MLTLVDIQIDKQEVLCCVDMGTGSQKEQRKREQEDRKAVSSKGSVDVERTLAEIRLIIDLHREAERNGRNGKTVTHRFARHHKNSSR